MLKLSQEYPELRSLYPIQPGEDPQDQYDFKGCYTATNEFGDPDRGDVAAALIISTGIYGDAAKLLRRSRAEISNFIAKDKELVTLVEDLSEGFIDEMVSLQTQIARAGNSAAQRFFLTTLGSHRGFSNLQRISGPSGGAIETVSQINLVAKPLPEGGVEKALTDEQYGHPIAPEDGGELPTEGTHEGI